MFLRLKNFCQKEYWFIYSHYWALKMTIGSMWRYYKGIVERMKMGMTLEQASERSLRVEYEYIGQIRDRILSVLETDKK